jgi:predicted nucleotidyltransferase
MTTAISSTYGLPNAALRQLLDVLSAAPGIERILLYGSRAKGTHRSASDIDICLVAPTLGLPDQLRLDVEIDELLLPSEPVPPDRQPGAARTHTTGRDRSDVKSFSKKKRLFSI